MNKLAYHAKYFEAISFWELGMTGFKSAGDNGKGMGECVAYIKMAVSKLKESEPFVKGAGANYAANY